MKAQEHTGGESVSGAEHPGDSFLRHVDAWLHEFMASGADGDRTFGKMDDDPLAHTGAEQFVRGLSGSVQIDYRISCYAPKAYVKAHSHKVQEQVYHVLEGEGLMEIDGERRVVRKHDFIFLPAGVEHGISNTGISNLVFIVATAPIKDS